MLIGLLLSSSAHGTFAFRSVSRRTIQSRATSSSTMLSSSYLDSINGGVSTASPDTSYSTSPTAAAFSSSSTSSSASSNNFDHVPILSLSQADAIANSAINVCQRNGFSPVIVTILDAGSSTIVTKRMDGCSPVGFADFAYAKAYSCLVNKYPSRNFRDRYTAEPNQAAKFCQMTSMVATSGNLMAPFPGGIVLKVNDYVIGAVGVSGASGDEDEYCAIQGVIEAGIPGLSIIPEQHSCATVKD